MLNNTPNQLSKFRTKNSVEVNDDLRGIYSDNSQIKFKTLMLKSSLCEYSHPYIHVKGTITVVITTATTTITDNTDRYLKIALHLLTV